MNVFGKLLYNRLSGNLIEYRQVQINGPSSAMNITIERLVLKISTPPACQYQEKSCSRA